MNISGMISRFAVAGAGAAVVLIFFSLVPNTGEAGADVLINQPSATVCVGKTFQLGVWYQSFTGGPYAYWVRVYSPSGALLLNRFGDATTAWTFWNVPAAQVGTYKTIYVTPSQGTGYSYQVQTVAHICQSKTTTSTSSVHSNGARYHLAVSLRDLDSHGVFLTGDRIVVKVTAYKGALPVTTGAYVVNTLAPTENSGFCGMVIESPHASPTGYCELIFSQPGEFKVTESYGYGPYANLAKASQEVTINAGSP